MIAMRPMLSTHRLMRVHGCWRCCWPSRSRWAAVRRSWCRRAPAIAPPRETADAFVMPDGMRLPYRTWLPDGAQAPLGGGAGAARHERQPRCLGVSRPRVRRRRDRGVLARPARLRRHVGARLLARHAGAGGRRARDGGAAAPTLSARQADPDGREHGRGGADVPGHQRRPAAGGRLRAGRAGGLGPGGDERVPARRPVAGRQPRCRA